MSFVNWLTSNNKIKTDSICRYRWEQVVIQFNRAEIRTCCRTYPAIKITDADLQSHGSDVFLNHPNLLERRQEMLIGKKHSTCDECWVIEKSGSKSFRKNEYLNTRNEIIDYFKNVSNADTQHSDHPLIQKLSYSYKPTSLVLFLSNVCDLKCAYCYYGLSTSWSQENVQFNELSDSQKKDLKPTVPDQFETEFWNWFESTCVHLEHIGFTGGEPTLSPHFERFLDRIIKTLDQKNKKLTLSINTNFNYSDSKKDTVFKTFQKASLAGHTFCIDVSVDGLNEQGDYIRNGLSHQQWMKNFEELLSMKLPVNIGISPTVNVLIGPSLKGLIEKIFDYQIKFNTPINLCQNIVAKPEKMSPYILRPSDLQPFLEVIEYIHQAVVKLKAIGFIDSANSWSRYADFLQNMITTVQHNQNKNLCVARLDLIDYLEKNDRKRNTDYLKTFPELKSFFNFCKEQK